MRSRLFASVILGVAIVLTTAGCSMITSQQTDVPYSPSDGVNVPDSGAPLLIRNALVVANDAGTAGNLVAAVVNMTGDSHTLRIQVGDGANAIDKTLRVAANSVVSLGTEAHDPLLLEGIDTKPGATLPIYFQSGDAAGVKTDVPVLDGALSYYADLVPSPTPSP